MLQNVCLAFYGTMAGGMFSPVLISLHFRLATPYRQNKQLASSTLCSLLSIITLCGDTHWPFPILFSFSLPIGQFLRLSCDTPPQIVYSLMTAHWGVPSPNLVVSVVGGGGCEKVKTWVREVLRQGLVKAAQRTGETHTHTYTQTDIPWCAVIEAGQSTAEDNAHSVSSICLKYN